MTELGSGDFVYYRLADDEGSPEEIGLVLRTSANEKADGSKDEFVELVGPLTKVLVPDGHCRKFDQEPEQDPNEVVGGSAETVGGVRRTATKATPDKTTTGKG